MSGASHTPGPWAWDGTTGFNSLDGANGDMLLHYTTSDDGVHCANPADAPLIAAAPELLAFAEGLDCECDSYHGHTCKRCIVIAKARGEA